MQEKTPDGACTRLGYASPCERSRLDRLRATRLCIFGGSRDGGVMKKLFVALVLAVFSLATVDAGSTAEAAQKRTVSKKTSVKKSSKKKVLAARHSTQSRKVVKSRKVVAKKRPGKSRASAGNRPRPNSAIATSVSAYSSRRPPPSVASRSRNAAGGPTSFYEYSGSLERVRVFLAVASEEPKRTGRSNQFWRQRARLGVLGDADCVITPGARWGGRSAETALRCRGTTSCSPPTR